MNMSFAHEQEGFGKVLSHNENEFPKCCSVPVSAGTTNFDFRGYIPGNGYYRNDIDHIEWETPPVENEGDCTFSFIIGTHVIPEFRPAYPYVTATLAVGETVSLPIPLAYPRYYQTAKDGVCLSFEPRRFTSATEAPHRFWNPEGVSGIYRLTVPGAMLTKGHPVKIRLTPDKTDMDVVAFAALSPRKDVLPLSLAALREETTRLQSDMVELKLSLAMLQAKVYPEMFPKYLKAERGMAVVEDTRHMHPPTLCKYDGDTILITYRRATDHLALDGAIYAVRSFDMGKTFTKPEKLFDLGSRDHRSTPLLQISSGDLVGTDYRAGAYYDAQGKYIAEELVHATQWGVWSEDIGKTWNFTDRPITVPGEKYAYCEMERPIIELPNGRLLLTAMYCKEYYGEGKGYLYAVGIWYSDDKGRSWEYLSSIEPHTGVAPPHEEGEPTIIRCNSGKLVTLMRSEAVMATDWDKKGNLLQSESYDNGKTWSKPHPTDMPSMSTPAHLTLLADGRLLVTHASRAYPASVYLTVSDDEGETWNTQSTKIVTQDLLNWDSTYPTTVQFSDGSLFTVWYGSRFGKFFIGTAKYGLEDL
jgi:hypothetical protein